MTKSVNRLYLIAEATARASDGEPDNIWDRLTDYALERDAALDGGAGRVFRGWSREQVKIMLAYHAAKKTLVYYQLFGGQVAGLLTWHRTPPGAGWEWVEQWKEDVPGGDVLLAHAFADSAMVRRFGCMEFLRRVPDAPNVPVRAYRWKRGEPRLVLYPFKNFIRLLS